MLQFDLAGGNDCGAHATRNWDWPRLFERRRGGKVRGALAGVWAAPFWRSAATSWGLADVFKFAGLGLVGEDLEQSVEFVVVGEVQHDLASASPRLLDFHLRPHRRA